MCPGILVNEVSRHSTPIDALAWLPSLLVMRPPAARAVDAERRRVGIRPLARNQLGDQLAAGRCLARRAAHERAGVAVWPGGSTPRVVRACSIRRPDAPKPLTSVSGRICPPRPPSSAANSARKSGAASAAPSELYSAP